MMKQLIFSSDNLPDDLGNEARFDQWRDIYTANIASLDFSISQHLPFQAEMKATLLQDVIVGNMSGTINGVVRRSRNISEDRGTAEFNLVINNGEGLMSGTQLGREFILETGAGALVMNKEPLVMKGSSENRWTSIVLPRSVLGMVSGTLEDRTSQGIPASNEALQLLNRYSNTAVGQIMPQSPELAAHMSGVIIDLAGILLNPRPSGQAGMENQGLRAARLAGILDFINQNFSNPEISANTVARAFELSPRYVHDLLYASGKSFGERVLDLRLELSLNILANPQNKNRRISDVAFSCGFNDISYFNRAFRRRFGCSPRQAR